MMQQDNHIFQGMRRDTHPIRQDGKFLWDAHNIRLTAREGDSMYSITNERSTKELFTFSSTETYIGHTVLGKYLVLFTHSNNNTGDIIYRINLDTLPDEASKVVLYEGPLNFDKDFPIQAIGDYESELIQKVYWVDGKNNPRVINITKPELMGMTISEDTVNFNDIYKDSPFDFVQSLALNEEVTVKRLENGNGVFPAGVIQYAFTYYHKYGQESNIFHVTEPLYIAHKDRGGSAEDNISTAFSIEIENIQTDFQYLRIYSIVRTSIDATPSVRRVTDIKISGNKTLYIDNGTVGDSVDPSMLLYIGGKDIIAGCIASKDNTLFLGNITYRREEAGKIDGLTDAVKNLTISTGTRTAAPNSSKGDSFYDYYNQLSGNTSTFKTGETYRLGLQFQYRNGEWSEPLFIRDLPMNGVFPDITSDSIELPIFKTQLGEYFQNMLEKGYFKVRPLVVLPSTKDRTVLAQGILCPTVFNAGSRESNSPFSQSSWFLRPFSTSNPINDNNDNASKGAVAEFRHYFPLLTGLNRGAEIQNMFISPDSTSDTPNITLAKTKEALTGEDRNSAYEAIYYVDQSVLTFHSPDIEFDTSTMLGIGDSNNLKVSLVGVVDFSSSYGDIDIQEETVVINPEASGYIHRFIMNNTDGGRSLISGLFYEDSYVNDTTNAEKFEKNGPARPWMTYLWHRSGSLNNDCVRPEDKGTRTASLKKKVISNIRYSKKIWRCTPSELDTSDIQIFNSNEVSLVRIKDEHNINGSISYYGNVDSINSSYAPFRLVTGASGSGTLLPGSHEFNGYIKNPGGSVSEVYFSSLTVEPQTGDKVSGTMKGRITSHTIIELPIGDTNEYLELYDSSFEIIISGGSSTLRNYTGYITKDNKLYNIYGTTDYVIKYSDSPEEIAFDFDSILTTVDVDDPLIGDYQTSLKFAKDAVRIKYKSTPHAVFATAYENGTRQPLPVISGTVNGNVPKSAIYWQDNIDGSTSGSVSSAAWSTSVFTGMTSCPKAYLWLAEIRQNVDPLTRFGGNTPEALRNNLWIPAGPAVRLGSDKPVEWWWGDTWFQRYDCLKTCPFTRDDINQMVEIGSFMCETRVNIDGRYDRNRGATSNLNMSPVNFNLINPVYSQKNNFFNYRILDSDYYKVDSYPSQIVYTGVKSPSDIQDTWTNIHMANSLDLDGSNGELVAIESFNDLLIGFQESGVQQIMFNSRVQIQPTDGVPIEIANSQRVEDARQLSNIIGCQDKFSIVTTPMGIYFLDNRKDQMYLFNGQLNDLGLNLGSLYWPRENHSDMTWRFKADKSGLNGIRLFYDSKFQDVYFTPGMDYGGSREALCYSEQLQQFTSLMSYGGAVMFSHDTGFYSIAENESGVLALYKNFEGDSYNNIFGRYRGFGFSFISNDHPEITKIFDTVEMKADSYTVNGTAPIGDIYSTKVQEGRPFDYIRVSNEYQDTDGVDFTASTLRKKFRVWRALIPRKKNTRERIRNPWAKITLGSRGTEGNLTIVHDVSVKYTV